MASNVTSPSGMFTLPLGRRPLRERAAEYVAIAKAARPIANSAMGLTLSVGTVANAARFWL